MFTCSDSSEFDLEIEGYNVGSLCIQSCNLMYKIVLDRDSQRLQILTTLKHVLCRKFLRSDASGLRLPRFWA